MDTKKLLMIALAAGSLSLFAACGDDNGNGGGDGGEDECSLDEAPPCDLGEDINPTATCIDDVAEEEPENFRVTSIAIPAASAPIGFDLDCFDTSSTDELIDAFHLAITRLRNPGGAASRINGHRDHTATACPGNLYARVQDGSMEPGGTRTHTVRAGETLYSIGQQYGVPWQSIAEANGISEPYTIYEGQVLVIPPA